MARIVDREAKRLRVLEAAAFCFAKSGYDATSMSDVAETAGLSKGSLYDYFDDKENLFYAVFAWLQQRLMEASLAQMTPGRSASEQIVQAAGAAIAGLVEHITLYPLSLEVWAAAARTGTRERFAEAMQQIYRDYRRQFAGLIRAAQLAGEIEDSADAEGLAAVLTGAIDGLMLQYWLDPSFDPRQMLQNFLSALFSGISSDE